VQPPAGQLCLSFDDAPAGEGAFLTGKERTAKLIAQLDALGIPEVVFFCVTERLQWRHGRQRIEQYAKAGHLIANHSHTHPAPETNGAQAYIAEIRQAGDSLRQFSAFTPWFRYPFLNEGRTVAVRDSIREALSSLGYRNGYVTIDTWDWYLDQRCRNAAKDRLSIDTAALGEIYVQTLWDAVQFYDRMAQDVLGSSPKHILLLHENDLAALYIDDLVNCLRAHNWEIISPTEAYAGPLAECVPDALYSNQGLIVAIAVDADYDGPLRHPSEGADHLDSLLQARQVFTKP
jgi:peptidoglycan/xylan/chitin deacetylase (PgdA/CDA1 family)